MTDDDPKFELFFTGVLLEGGRRVLSRVVDACVDVGISSWEGVAKCEPEEFGRSPRIGKKSLEVYTAARQAVLAAERFENAWLARVYG